MAKPGEVRTERRRRISLGNRWGDRAVEAGVEGLLVAVAVLAGAAVFGLWRRRVDGRLRPLGRRSVGAGQAAEPRSGPASTRPANVTGGSARRAVPTLSPADLGHDLGRTATFVSFSTAFCQPCRANRQVLGHLTASTDGVAHVEIDAESRLDLVRRLGVTRTPTTFVLDGAGMIRRRATGVLRLADARATVGELTSV